MEIEVSDRGPGIPTKRRRLVFARFGRVSNRMSDGVARTGIGLTIARQLARQHDGDLTLLPTDHGAAFLATLHPLTDS